ncbi:hypothetical protein VP01_14594g1, partial [Puccinia sorghi]
KDNKMTATTDGGEILPDSVTIITYIQREVQQASIVKRRQDMRSKEPSQTKAPGKKWSEFPPVSNNWEKKLDAVTKQLASFTSQKGVPPHMKSIKQLLAATAPFREPSFKCYYCFQQNHSSKRCSILSLDKSSGAQGKIKLPYNQLTCNT